MKKNITINFFGTTYAIDEDAYELLERYISSISSYFSTQEGGEEISEDIERRISELFSELRGNGVESIDITMVRDVIGRIGQVEEIVSDASEATEGSCSSTTSDGLGAQNEQDTIKKKLFRDTHNGVLGGVLSGLACRFSGDVVIWRLIVTLAALATAVLPFVLVYIVLWIIIPEAVTEADFLQMKGKPVTIDSIGEAVIDYKGRALKTGTWICKGILAFLGGLLMIVLGFSVIGILIVLVLLAYGWVQNGNMFEFVLSDSEIVSAGATAPFLWLMVAVLVFLGIPFYCILHHMLTYFKVSPMSIRQRIAWMVLWLVSLLVLVCASVDLSVRMEKSAGSYYTHNNWTWAHKAYLAGCLDFGNDSIMNSSRDKFHFAKEVRISDRNSRRVLPGWYRLKVGAYSDKAVIEAYVQTCDSVYRSTVQWGTSEKVLDNEGGHFTLCGLPKAVVDSVFVKEPQDVEFGLRMVSDTVGSNSHKRFYIMYFGDYELEKLD